MRYTVVLEQESDGGYVASVPALAGCVSQGDSRAAALANIREAIELYVEPALRAASQFHRPGARRASRFVLIFCSRALGVHSDQ